MSFLWLVQLTMIEMIDILNVKMKNKKNKLCHIHLLSMLSHKNTNILS